jgi:hypothetical protein
VNEFESRYKAYKDPSWQLVQQVMAQKLTLMRMRMRTLNEMWESWEAVTMMGLDLIPMMKMMQPRTMLVCWLKEWRTAAAEEKA